MASSSGAAVDDEDTPLLPGRTRSWLAMRYGSTRKCVSSKAALLVLLWSFVVGLLGTHLLNPDMYVRVLIYPHGSNDTNGRLDYAVLGLSLLGGATVLTCFFPVAGILADIKYGRYKTVVTSLSIVLLAAVLVAGVGAILYFSGLFRWPRGIGVVCYVLGGMAVIMLYVGLIGFTANVVQFGMDQLHDSPAEDSTLFIHWYVWTYYASFFITQTTFLLAMLLFNYVFGFAGLYLPLITLVVVAIVLAITLCFIRRRRWWFLIEPGGLNPYKLVYRVTKFARQHKVPVQRSAFTYCEDELPSGLDLGKEKYGGCFTTEQVEDVKAFYGILKVLFSFGIFFFLDFQQILFSPSLLTTLVQCFTGKGRDHT